MAESLASVLAARPFSCALSSGFFGFFAHTGFVRALFEAGLRPRRFSGSSAGALVSAVIASGTSPLELWEELEGIERKDFWDPGLGLGLLRGELFRKRIHRMLREKTFEACPVPVAISVFDLGRMRTEVIGRGDLSFAVRASCSFPFLLQPARRGGRMFIDGGVKDRPGLAGLPAGEPVLFHHLVSSSPWRPQSSPSAQIPQREEMRALALAGLPRSGPHKLAAGKRAMHLAYEATKRALDLPASDTRVVDAS